MTGPEGVGRVLRVKEKYDLGAAARHYVECGQIQGWKSPKGNEGILDGGAVRVDGRRK
jgi:hypothetical protein